MKIWINFEELFKFIVERTNIQDDHLLWRKITTGGLLVTQCGILPANVTNKRTVYRPHVLYFMYRTRVEKPNKNLHLIRTCNFENCIVHYLETYTNIVSVREMTCDQYEHACLKFGSQCSPQDPKTGCINFNGYVNKTGYSVAAFLGRQSPAHRVAWELANADDVPCGLIVRHLCPIKNKLCVFPGHLVHGTHKENTKDEIDGGFKKRGEGSAVAKMSEFTAREIIESFVNDETPTARADKFGVNVAVIRSLDHATSWKHLFTEEDLIKRNRINKPKKQITSVKDVISIRKLIKTQSRHECATQFNICKETVDRIVSCKSFKLVHENEDVREHLEKTNNIAYFNKVAERIKKSSTTFIDKLGKTHWLYKNDSSQNARAKYYRMRIFGRPVFVHKASFMAFNKEKLLPVDIIIRHKCRFKHCVSPDCLESGTSFENSNDMRRDGTILTGERNPSAKINEDVAMKIKYTKGIGTVQQRSEFFNVGSKTVASIDCGLNWKYLPKTVPHQETIDNIKKFISESKKRKSPPLAIKSLDSNIVI